MSNVVGGVGERIASAAAGNPTLVAVRVDRGDRITLATLDRRANRLARALAPRLAPGEPVAVLCCDTHAPDLLVAYVAAQRAGAVPAVLDPGTTPEALSAALRLVTPRLVLACSDGVAAWDATRHPVVVVGDDPGVVWWRSLEARHTPEPLAVASRPGDPAELVVETGAGGELTARTLTHAEVLAAAVLPEPAPDGQVLHAVPLALPAGRHALTLGAALGGATAVLQTPFEPSRYYRLLAGASVAYLLPGQVDQLVAGTHWLASPGGLCRWTPADADAEGAFGLLVGAG